jgi:predicted transcriptional regulator
MANDRHRTAASPDVSPDDETTGELTAEERAAIQEARADYAAGRYYTHDQIVRWLRTWGTDQETDGPE